MCLICKLYERKKISVEEAEEMLDDFVDNMEEEHAKEVEDWIFSEKVEQRHT